MRIASKAIKNGKISNFWLFLLNCKGWQNSKKANKELRNLIPIICEKNRQNKRRSALCKHNFTKFFKTFFNVNKVYDFLRLILTADYRPILELLSFLKSGTQINFGLNDELSFLPVTSFSCLCCKNSLVSLFWLFSHDFSLSEIWWLMFCSFFCSWSEADELLKTLLLQLFAELEELGRHRMRRCPPSSCWNSDDDGCWGCAWGGSRQRRELLRRLRVLSKKS